MLVTISGKLTKGGKNLKNSISFPYLFPVVSQTNSQQWMSFGDPYPDILIESGPRRQGDTRKGPLGEGGRTRIENICLFNLISFKRDRDKLRTTGLVEKDPLSLSRSISLFLSVSLSSSPYFLHPEKQMFACRLSKVCPYDSLSY